MYLRAEETLKAVRNWKLAMASSILNNPPPHHTHTHTHVILCRYAYILWTGG